MKKTISICLLIAILCSALMLSSCSSIKNWLLDNFVSQGPDNVKYYATKNLYSYDDLIDALAIVGEKHELNPTYTVEDMGEGYTVVYNFWNAVETEYPIDYESFFTTKSNGGFSTYIFMDGQPCPGHEDHTMHGSDGMYLVKYDEDFEKLSGYDSLVGVYMHSHTFDVVELEDKELLSYRESISDGNILYFVYYGEKEIMRLKSCVTLDNAFFERFFAALVVVNPEN